MSSTNRGIAYCLLSQVIWGIMPIYWKYVTFVDPFALIAHRILWSFVFMVMMVFVIRESRVFFRRLREKAQLRYSVPGAALIVFNWFIYVYAIQKGFILQTSLGYYICPLILALVGWTYYKEKPRPAQIVAAILTTIGVILQVIAIGKVPYYSFAIALSFAFYSLVKKQTPYSSVNSMGYETIFLLPLSLVVLALAKMGGWELTMSVSTGAYALLMLLGPLTVAPLLFHSYGVRSAPLSVVAFLQYLSPTIGMVLGVLVYGELFTSGRLIAFAFSWAAILLFAADQWWHSHHPPKSESPLTKPEEPTTLVS